MTDTRQQLIELIERADWNGKHPHLVLDAILSDEGRPPLIDQLGLLLAKRSEEFVTVEWMVESLKEWGVLVPHRGSLYPRPQGYGPWGLVPPGGDKVRRDGW